MSGSHIGRTALLARFGIIAVLAAALLLSVARQASAGQNPGAGTQVSPEFILQGQVVAVEDGDTLTLRGHSGARFYIRLSDIDAPEIYHPAGHGHGPRPGQPFGEQAGDLLRRLALNHEAEARCFEIDYGTGRPVCHVLVEGKPLHRALLEAGLAWAEKNPRWRRDPQTAGEETAAKASHRGLWAAPRPVAPWDWRAQCWGNKPGPATGCRAS